MPDLIQRISNRTYLVGIGIGFLLYVTSTYVIPKFPLLDLPWLRAPIVWFFYAMSLGLLLKHSNINSWRMAYLIHFFSIVILSTFFLQKLPWDFIRFAYPIGYAGLAIVYSIRYFDKEKKNYVDTLKWLWILACGIVQILWFLPIDVFLLALDIRFLLFLGMICSFIYKNQDALWAETTIDTYEDDTHQSNSKT